MKKTNTNIWKKNIDRLQEKGEISNTALLNTMIDNNDTLGVELIKEKMKDVYKKGLNNDQINAFDLIADYLDDKNSTKDGIVLKGFAGTGKTYLVKRIIEYIMSTDESSMIAITAPTNKAVHVLAESANFGNKTQIFESFGTPTSRLAYCTIHKLLGLKEVISDTGEVTFESDSKSMPNLLMYKCIIIDESSMINTSLYYKFIKYKKKVKFIFMGDPCQIPPVNEFISIPFSGKCNEDFDTIYLKQVMRQKEDNPLLEACTELRNNIKNDNPIDVKTKINNNTGIYVFENNEKEDILEVMNSYYRDPQYRDNINYIKTIAWRNATISYLNTTIRNMIYPNEKLNRFMIGEKIIANKPIFSYDVQTDRYNIIANTSDEFIVEDVYYSKQPVNNYLAKQFGGPQWFKTIKLEVKNLSSDYYTPDIQLIDESDFLLFKEFCNNIRSLAMKKKDKSLWITYFDCLKWNADISYAYAISAHKSQGSTYNNVIIIEEDIDKNNKTLERNRIKYTAYSRAKEKLFILK